MGLLKENLSGFKIAFSMMTTIPLFSIGEFKKGCNGLAVMYYPIIGLILGGIIYFLYFYIHGFLAETHLKVLLFALFILLYGAIHLDGFSDTVDGLFAHPKARALEVMKDPNIGAMGAIFTFLFILVKLSSFIALEDLFVFILVPMMSRWSAGFAIKKYEYVRKSGIATLAKEEFTTKLFVISTLFVITAGTFVDFKIFIILFVFTVISTLLISSFFKKKFGGLSGDMYGSIIELNELLLLNILVFMQ